MSKIFLIILLSIPIFQYRIYWLLVDKIGVEFAYFTDQFLPLIVTSIMAMLVMKKYVPTNALKKYVLDNKKPIFIIIIVSLIVHGWMLGNYFMGEEPTTILSFINDDSKGSLVDGILRGYHYGVYVLSYKLFYTNTIFYNAVSLTLYIISAIILYIFLSHLLNKKIVPSLVGALFYVTTPAYLDMFFWQSNVSGMPIALSAGVLSLLCLFTYQKTQKLVYYLLSIMFYLAMIKIGFTRFYAFIALPLYMCLLPMTVRFNKLVIKKFFLLAFPYVSILLSYLLIVFILPNHVFENGITVKGAPLNTDGYFGVFFMLVAYLFIPSKFAESYYSYIKQWEFIVPAHVSLTLIFGIFYTLILLIVGIIALKNIKQIKGRLVIFSLIIIFANIVLTPLLIKGYSNPTLLDQRFSNTGVSNGPGIRYVFTSAMGLATLAAAITYWLIEKKKYIKVLLIFISSLFIYYSYLNIVSYIIALKIIHPNGIAVPNHVFSMVPKDGKKKLLYSVNPKTNSIDGKIGDWLHAFYKLDELKYTNSSEEVQKMIANREYEKNNFYAFYNNTVTQTFKDVSELAREEFYNVNPAQQTTQLIFDATLTTSFQETDNPSFPLILNRGIFVSQDLNQRLLKPRKVIFSIEKTWLPARFPYVDGYEPKEKYMDPFPLSLWDTLTNKPLIVSLKSLDGILKADKHYVGSQETLTSFQKSLNFNSLALLYVCAEDADWEKQSKTPLEIGGIWYTREFYLNEEANEQILTSLTCFGSVLRKIILIGPPIQSEITIQVI